MCSNGVVDISALLLELYGRIPPLCSEAVSGLDTEALAWRPAPAANPIGWLVWHLARVQDHHIAELVGNEQVWQTSDWPAHFGLDGDPSNIGYGHSSEEVATVRPDGAESLLGYLGEVEERTRRFVAAVTPDDLDRIVDRRWDPPVSLGVRLVSVADDCLQHAGQAAYVRGLRAA